ncbi:uncharacterized protein TNCV_2706471 [Trichonephila clavipes]|nr:uncharacterized protein TNCV_2706471 [Trichonephila clavipes]
MNSVPRVEHQKVLIALLGPNDEVVYRRQKCHFITTRIKRKHRQMNKKGIDEEHFWLNGYVNKQNCRIWSEANPQVYVETPLHPEKLTVWCALWAGAVVPTRRRNMSRATIDLLKGTFGDCLISRFGPVNWPPRSCDLTPLDYFLWGYVKSLVYAISHKRLTIWKTTHSPCYCRYTATNVGKSHRKLDVQIGLHPSQPWQSYAKNHI